jgi:hypothetical protein
VRTGETAAETYSTDNNGNYEGMEEKKLGEIEPTLNDTSSATFKVVSAKENEYKLESKSATTKDVFTIERTSTGAIVRECTTPTKKAAGGCPKPEVAGGW